jgi:hypothetical protein
MGVGAARAMLVAHRPSSYYPAFRKDFYVPVPELRNMTDEEIAE